MLVLFQNVFDIDDDPDNPQASSSNTLQSDADMFASRPAMTVDPRSDFNSVGMIHLTYI